MKLPESNVLETNNCDEYKIIPLNAIDKLFVYFCLDENNDILYIGSTKVGINRFWNRTYEKKLDYTTCSDIKIIICNEKERFNLERYCIHRYKPKYNVYYTNDKQKEYNKLIRRKKF